MWKKFSARVVVCILFLSVGLVFVPSVYASPDEISVVNENLALYVERGVSDGIGTFTLETINAQDLLYTTRDHNAWSSYLTIQVDGENYTSGVIAENGNPIRMNEYVTQTPTIVDNSIVTEWNLPEDIKVKQKIRLLGMAAKFSITTKNERNQSRNVKVRLLFDYQVKEQDGSPIYVNGEILTKERRYPNPDFDSWYTYDQIPEPTLRGKAILLEPPYLLTFANWDEANNYAFDYTGFDSERDFYTPGEIRSPESDSCALLYWDLGTIAPGKSKEVATYYGVGEPSEYESVKKALKRYQSTVNDSIEEYIKTKAEVQAELYENYGDNFSEGLTAYFGYKGGNENLAENIPQDLRKMWDNLTRDLSRENATAIYGFLKEMFGRSSEMNSLEERKDMFYEYYMGTYPGQENYYLLDGQSIADLLEDFNQRFDTKENEIMSSLKQRNISYDNATLIASIIRSRAKDLEARTASEVKNYRNLASLVNRGENLKTLVSVANLEGSPQVFTLPFFVMEGTLMILGIEVCTLLPPTLSGVFTDSTAVFNPSPPDYGNVEEAAKMVPKKTARRRAFHVATTAKDARDDLNTTYTLVNSLLDKRKELKKKRGEIVSLHVNDIESEDLNSPPDSDVSMGKGIGTVVIKNTGDVPLITNPDLFIPRLSGDIQTLEEGEIVPGGSVSFPRLPSIEGHDAVEAPNLTPGETATIVFEYEVPVDYFSCEDYILFISFDHNLYGVDEKMGESFKAYDDIDACELTFSDVVAEGKVKEGEFSETTHTPKNDTDTVTYTLWYSGSDLDLHLYDQNGNHVGMNYNTGEIETQISNAEYSGSYQELNRRELIRVSDSTSESYTIKIVAMDTELQGTNYILSVSEVPELPPVLQLRPNKIDVEAVKGKQKKIKILIEEFGGFNNLSNVNLTATDLKSESGNINSSNIHFNKNNFKVPAGGLTTVTITVNVPPETIHDTYSGYINASAENVSDATLMSLDVKEVLTILEYYCNWEGNPKEVSTIELLTAADHWTTGKIVNGFDRSIKKGELLQLAEWWVKGKVEK